MLRYGNVYISEGVQFGMASTLLTPVTATVPVPVLVTPVPAAVAPTKPEVIPFRERKSLLDCVKEDGVMKELILNQEKARDKWEERWGFMKNPRKLWEEEAAKRGLPPDVFDRRNKRREPASWPEDRKPTTEIISSKPVPILSSGMIGWRSSVKENNLNLIAGPLFESRTVTMNPPLSPTEPDPRHQRFIFLG